MLKPHYHVPVWSSLSREPRPTYLSSVDNNWPSTKQILSRFPPRSFSKTFLSKLHRQSIRNWTFILLMSNLNFLSSLWLSNSIFLTNFLPKTFSEYSNIQKTIKYKNNVVLTGRQLVVHFQSSKWLELSKGGQGRKKFRLELNDMNFRARKRVMTFKFSSLQILRLLF